LYLVKAIFPTGSIFRKKQKFLDFLGSSNGHGIT